VIIIIPLLPPPPPPSPLFFFLLFLLLYRFLFCFGLFLLCGSIGVAGSTLFVKRIYRNIKVD